MQNKKNVIIFTLAFIGVFIALYLTNKYLTGNPVVCFTGGCEKVRLSQYSKIVGIPVPLFGLVGYILIALMSFLRTLSSDFEIKYLKPIFYISVGGLLFSAYNNLVDWLLIKAFCQYCFICLLIMACLVVVSKKELYEKGY